MSDKLLQAGVRWGDGTYDHGRTCMECGLTVCKQPVYYERYRTISSAKAKAFDAQSGLNDINSMLQE